MKKILLLALALAMPGFAFAAGNALPGAAAAATSVKVGATLVTTQGVTFANPHQVWRYRITCTDANWVQVSVADCCLAGDKWRVETDIKDFKPNDGVTIAPGAPGVYSMPSIIRTFGAQGNTTLDAIVAVSYPHGGINTWPAGLTLKFITNGTCVPTITNLGASYN